MYSVAEHGVQTKDKKRWKQLGVRSKRRRAEGGVRHGVLCVAWLGVARKPVQDKERHLRNIDSERESPSDENILSREALARPWSEYQDVERTILCRHFLLPFSLYSSSSSSLP